MTNKLFRTWLYAILLASVALAACGPSGQAAPATGAPATRVAQVASALPLTTATLAATATVAPTTGQLLCADWNAYLKGGCQIPPKPYCASQAEWDAANTAVPASEWVTDAQGNRFPNPFLLTCWDPPGGWTVTATPAVPTALDPSVCPSVAEYQRQYLAALVIVDTDGNTVSQGTYPNLQPIPNAPYGPGTAKQTGQVCQHFSSDADAQTAFQWGLSTDTAAEQLYCTLNVPAPVTPPDGLVPTQIYSTATQVDCMTPLGFGSYQGKWIHADWQVVPGSAFDQQIRSVAEAHTRVMALQDGLPTDAQLKAYDWNDQDAALVNVQQQIARLKTQGSYLRLDWGSLSITQNGCSFDLAGGVGCGVDLWAHQITISKVDLATGQTTEVEKGVGYDLGSITVEWFVPHAHVTSTQAHYYAAQGGLFAPLFAIAPAQ